MREIPLCLTEVWKTCRKIFGTKWSWLSFSRWSRWYINVVLFQNHPVLPDDDYEFKIWNCLITLFIHLDLPYKKAQLRPLRKLAQLTVRGRKKGRLAAPRRKKHSPRSLTMKSTTRGARTKKSTIRGTWTKNSTTSGLRTKSSTTRGAQVKKYTAW